MHRRITVTALAGFGLLAVAVAPALAGQGTGSWKYWNPNMGYATPPHWSQHQHHGRPGWRHGHRAHRGHDGAAYAHGYPQHRGW
jgi:hypothetical protein